MHSFFRRDSGTYEVVRPGNVSDEQHVPDHIVKPSYYFQYEPPRMPVGFAEVKRDGQIEKLRESCRIAANVLKKCANIVQV